MECLLGYSLGVLPLFAVSLTPAPPFVLPQSPGAANYMPNKFTKAYEVLIDPKVYCQGMGGREKARWVWGVWKWVSIGRGAVIRLYFSYVVLGIWYLCGSWLRMVIFNHAVVWTLFLEELEKLAHAIFLGVFFFIPVVDQAKNLRRASWFACRLRSGPRHV
ncbi:unnamed protein product [Choristocarpus tenellus]